MMEVIERDYQQLAMSLTTGSETAVDMLDVLLVLVRRRRLVVAFTATGLLAGFLLAFFLEPDFTATATILPPQQQSSSAVLLNQLGSLANLSSGDSVFGLKTPADMYVGILESRTIADELIGKYGLRQLYNDKTQVDARRDLRKRTSIDVGKDGLIEISVTDHDAKRASDLANAYIEALNRLNSTLAVGEAAQRRAFFDQQLDTERTALASAENDLQSTQQRTGLIQINGQAEAIIQSIEQLRAEIASREVQLQSLRSYATQENPKVVRLESEIAEMHSQLSKMENDQRRETQPGDIAVPTGSIPKDSLDYTRKLRAVKYHESLFDLLSKQEEAARIDEAKSAPVIQVVDHAVSPDKRSGPPRMLIALGLGIAGCALGALSALAEYWVKRLQQIPHQRQKLISLRSLLLKF